MTEPAKLLRVFNDRVGFCGGAVFDKIEGKWVMRCCAPYLKKVVRGVPVSELGKHLQSKGFTYEWI